MTLSDYLRIHGVDKDAFAARVGASVSALYRWLAWERRKAGEAIPDRSCSQPRADEIIAIQRETGGLVTLLNWQSPVTPAATEAA